MVGLVDQTRCWGASLCRSHSPLVRAPTHASLEALTPNSLLAGWLGRRSHTDEHGVGRVSVGLRAAACVRRALALYRPPYVARPRSLARSGCDDGRWTLGADVATRRASVQLDCEGCMLDLWLCRARYVPSLLFVLLTTPVRQPSATTNLYAQDTLYS
jgi:hypothetical protein